MNALVGKERKCALCKRTFIVYPEWAYRRFRSNRELIFCSWKCLRAFEAGTGTKTPIERREQIIAALKDGLNVKEVALMLNEDVRKVWYWENKLKKERERDERKAKPEAGQQKD